jgi:hypothetical protein
MSVGVKGAAENPSSQLEFAPRLAFIRDAADARLRVACSGCTAAWADLLRLASS